MNPQVVTSTAPHYIQTAGQLGQTALASYNAALPTLEIFAVLAVAVLITGSIIIIIKTGWFSYHMNNIRNVILKTDMPKQEAVAAWAIVQKHFFAGDTNDLKVAVMEADNILNDALRYAGVRGVNLGDRLKNVKHGQIPNIEDVWAAHKLRNEIAHEMSFPLKRDTAERALESFKTALKNLGVFDSLA